MQDLVRIPSPPHDDLHPTPRGSFDDPFKRSNGHGTCLAPLGHVERFVSPFHVRWTRGEQRMYHDRLGNGGCMDLHHDLHGTLLQMQRRTTRKVFEYHPIHRLDVSCALLPPSTHPLLGKSTSNDQDDALTSRYFVKTCTANHGASIASCKCISNDFTSPHRFDCACLSLPQHCAITPARPSRKAGW